MSTRSFVGVYDAGTRTVRARYVHSDGTPGYMVPTLQAICRDTFAGDTTAMRAALLANDWSYLGVDVTPDTASSFDDEHPITGVGMAMRAEPDDEAITVAMSDLSSLDVGWVYLIDPSGATLTVHSPDSGDEPVGRHTLTG